MDIQTYLRFFRKKQSHDYTIKAPVNQIGDAKNSISAGQKGHVADQIKTTGKIKSAPTLITAPLMLFLAKEQYG